jgi:microcystin-dependent protein
MADLIIQPKNDDHLKLNNDAGTTIVELANDESKLRLAQNNISASDGTTAITTSSADVTVAGDLNPASGPLNFVGMIAPFAMASVPDGWLACDGSAVSRTTYSVLFGVISTTWGTGDGSSTFNLPDLEGAFLRGTGSNDTHNMADGSDFAGPSVGSFENDQIQKHQHELTWQGASVGANNISGSVGVHGLNTDGANYNIAAYIAANFQAFGFGTPRVGDETRPFNAGVKFLIKY